MLHCPTLTPTMIPAFCTALVKTRSEITPCSGCISKVSQLIAPFLSDMMMLEAAALNQPENMWLRK